MAIVELPPLIAEFLPLFPAGQPVYLVGGSLRDLLLGRPVHDLDFALPLETRRTARRIANRLKAGFFMMDDARDTSRVLHHSVDGAQFMLDFVVLAENDLVTDLKLRDFTINAMAIDLHHPQQLIDPCGGQADLRAKVLRTCTPDALPADPLRCLRGVRLAVDLDLNIPAEIQTQLRANLPRLVQISPERVRDELVRMLEGPRPVEAVRLLDRLDGLPYVLPELVALKGVPQTAPHILDVWEHTLATLQHLVDLLAALGTEYSPAQAEDPWLGLACRQLGRFRVHFIELAVQKITNQRTRRVLLYLAALYHDVAKPASQTQVAAGRLHAFGHEQAGAELAAGRARALQFSNAEIDYLQTVVRQHMRIHFLAQADRLPSRKAVYHFFRDCGETGPDLCLLSLADTLATYAANLPETVFARELEVCRLLLAALWERPSESVRPMPLVNGNDLMAELGLAPGPQVGRLLELLREAQAEGRIAARAEAFDLARAWLADEDATH